MSKESFEDTEIADYLNQHYVSIKIDREERPDIDHIYMTACQAMIGSGGWPLSVFMTADKKPFYIGTYFPPHSKWGKPGFLDVLQKIQENWHNDYQLVLRDSEQLVKAVEPRFTRFEAGKIDERIIMRAYKQFAAEYDEKFGGFGAAPKFPTPHSLMFLLRYWKQSGNEDALMMVEKTLDCMYRGGIYDHIGFGFARYSTDQQWLVPHFEKMLYDNALLAYVYLEAYQATQKEEYCKVAEAVLTYVMRDMVAPQGGFYSAEDADSEGIEGNYYVWTPQEIHDILEFEEADLFCKVYDITGCANFENKSIPNLIHTSHIHICHEFGISREELDERLENARSKLFAAREQRIKPHKDDKILTGWNGLMIAAFAKAFQILKRPAYRETAAQAIECVLTKLRRRQDGRLYARYRDGEAKYLAYIDDYAFFIWGLIEQYQATFEPQYLELALELREQMKQLFWDEQNGGYFFYGSDGESLLSRPKEVYDGAIPSGNSVAAYVTIRLAKMTGRQELLEEAEALMKAFAGTVAEYPRAYPFFLMAIQFAVIPTKEIVIAGDSLDIQALKMVDAIRAKFLPDTVVVFCPQEQGKQMMERMEKVAPLVRDKRPLAKGKATAYICQNQTCKLPITDAEEMEQMLNSEI